MEENILKTGEKATAEPIFGPLPTLGAVQRSLEFDEIRKMNEFIFQSILTSKKKQIICAFDYAKISQSSEFLVFRPKRLFVVIRNAKMAASLI